MNRSKKGFTLVEIMIVVVIIGLLAALAIPAFQKVRRTSQTKAIVNNLRQVSGAAQQYFMESGAVTVGVYGAANTPALVGSSYYINTIQLVAGEAYPASVLATDIAITATGTGQIFPITFPY